MKKKKILLIAGHNRAGIYSYPHFSDPGVVLDNTDNEHWLMERLCSEAFRQLKREEYNVELCPFTYNLKGKIRYANKILTNRDVIVSVHGNGSPNKKVSGSEVFYAEGSRRSLIWSKKIAKIISDTIMIKNRGHKSDIYSHHGYLGILRNTVSYDFLLELGFLTNEEDYLKVRTYGVQAIIDTCKYILDKKT